MRIYHLTLLLAALLASSCAEEISPVISGEDGQLVETVFEAKPEQDKTALDGRSIKWTTTDEIAVLSATAGNQKFISSEVSSDGHVATFQGLTSKTGPWYAVYPFDASVAYDAEGPLGVVLPEVQTAAQGSFGDKANVSVAYAAKAGDVFTFYNLGALLSFTLNESDITRIVITSDNTLTGTADVNFNNGNPRLSFTSESKSVELKGSFSKGKTYYVSVAPGTFSNPVFRFEKESYYAELKSTGSKALERNGNYFVGTFTVPAGKWIKKVGISSADELMEFASLVNAGSSIDKFKDADGSVKLLCDINMEGKTWTSIGTTTSSLTYNTSVAPTSPMTDVVFDGCGHTVSNLSMSVDIQKSQAVYGMFGATKGGAIRNLTLDNASMSVVGSGISSNNAAVGLLVGYDYETEIENVHVNGTISGAATSTKDRTVSVGGVIGMLNSGNAVAVRNCSFSGSLTMDVGSKYTNSDTPIAGGIVASVSSKAANAVVDHCVNDARIDVRMHRAAGILGNAYAKVTHCVNNGEIVCNYSSKVQSATTVTGVRAGGIVAFCSTQSANSYCTENCTNNGRISTLEPDSGVGGIAGLVRCYTVTSCINKGNVYGPATGRGLLVGLVSTANSGCRTTFSDCSVCGSTGSSAGAVDEVASTSENYMDMAVNFLSGADRSSYTKDNVKFLGSEPIGGPGISTAQDLKEFAEAVNSGKSTAKWQNGDFIINLLNDVDCSSLSGWTPIGNPEFPFAEHFRGNGFVISNLKMVFTNSVEGPAYGLFGNVAKGAIIEDFILSASCSATMHPTKPVQFGAVVGAAMDAIVRDITNNAPVTFSESSITATSTLSAIGGIAGSIQTSSVPATISKLVNNGAVNVTETANTGSGSTSVYTGGIVGRAMASKESYRMTLLNCANNGAVNGTVCRIAGICGGPGKYVTFENCENRGNIFNNHHISGAGRPAGILCQQDDGAKLIKCKNYGDVISASSDRTGGIICNTSSSAGTLIQECENYGRVISDSQYRGTFFAYCHGGVRIVSCIAQGDLGTYNGGDYKMVGVNYENYFENSGYYTSAATYANKDNILWSRETTPASDTFGPDKKNASFSALAETSVPVKMSSKTENWTVTVSDSWIHLTDNAGQAVTSGVASDFVANLFLSADRNVTFSQRQGTVTFKSSSSSAKITVTQAASAGGFPSTWLFDDSTAGIYTGLWVNNGIAPATNGGSGTISVVRGSGTAPLKYSLSSNRCMVGDIVKGDYFLFTVPSGNLAAGTYIQFDCKLRPKSGGSHKYFIAEILDGGSWKSVSKDLRTASENSDVKYTTKLVYDSGTYQYACVYQIFKLTAANNTGTLQIRLRAVGDYNCNGAKETGAEIGLALDSYIGGNVNNLGTQAPTETKKVLWLGNSFTYYFSAPIKLEELAFSQRKQLDINAHVRGSQTFQNHCSLGESLEEINVGGYDYAFLQDQSTQPSDYGKDPVTYSGVKTWAKTLSDKVKAKSPGCTVIQEATWSFPKNNYNNYGSYEAFDNYMMKGCKEITSFCGNWMSPINVAFAQVRSKYPSYVLYSSDNKHQSDLGAYIVACCNYLVIFGQKFDANASNCGIDATKAANIRNVCESVVLGNEGQYNITR